MKICFCLYGINLAPIGGCKIIFEYANRLTDRNHEVSIVFNCKETFKKYRLPEFIRRNICIFLVKKYPKWFLLNKKITKIYVNSINDKTIPNGQIIVATAVTTAQDVFNLAPSKGKKVYFIQDFENWFTSDEEVFKTYEFNMNNIVISKWLKEKVDTKSQLKSTYISNAIDFSVFGIDVPINERDEHSIAMLYHTGKHKGCKYGLAAIFEVKKLYPDLKVRLFGIPKRPGDLPGWIKYTRNANQEQLRKIYNDAAIFLCASINEGFGLTGAESMACGCALVSTSYRGVFEYADNEDNALLSPAGDVNLMVENIVRLFSDNNFRIKIATNGVCSIKKLSWEDAVNKFEKAIIKYP